MEILNSADEITEDVINKACEALDEIKYSSNMRGTGEYRAAVSKVLVKKAIVEVL